ncbi:carboxypeptidase regulatory-like domain-containing protein [Spirosoma taeanense]|nr:carboxypeptidase regulatory-like domain-containing protein [Spirosoma taeanense]
MSIGLVQFACGQTPTVTLTGQVLDAATGKPLPFANVYLNNTTYGAVTDANGQFTLAKVPLGTVEVVASFLGYQAARQILRIDSPQPRSISFRLKPDNRALAGVTVKAKSKDRVWQRQLRRFRQQLFGEPFGGQCLITNSHALSFTEEDGHLLASAAEPLVIENQALGYRLYYDLLYFKGSLQGVYYAGSTRFEELPATDERQASRFVRNRMRAYRGSIRHLMASLIAGTYEQEGFLVYREDVSKPITTIGTPATLYDAIKQHKHLLPIDSALIRPGKLSFERQLVSIMPLVVFFTGASSGFSPYRDARYAYSQIMLPNRAMQVTTEGWITSPNGMEVKGSLADDRLSTLLPADWKPTETGGLRPGTDLAANAPRTLQGKLLLPDARLGRIATAFTERFRTLAPTLFVHIDKPFYATGDRMWLSAYLLDAPTQRLPVGETAIQVDLLAPSGKLVQHQWLHVINGRAVGNFRLSDSLSSGQYRLRAYTDEDEGQHRPAFERSVAVYNLVHNSTVAATDTARQPLDVQVLPEGGRWVAGLSSRLGVKVIGPDGRGKPVSGRLVDDIGTEAGRFTTNPLGMGSLVLTPQTGRNYYAEINQTGQQQLVPLPAVVPNGLTLSADMVSDTSRLILRVAEAVRPQPDSAYILFQHRGQLVERLKLLLQNGVAQVSLPVASLPVGLVQVTLYDAAARPQAERLVFIPERLPPVQILLSINKARYQPRELVTVNLTLTDDGLPAVATLSASITDAGQIPDDPAGATIQTHLLLTGELRGRVEQPNFYLENTTPETRRALDDLLLTQGWRRVSGTPSTDLLGGVSVIGRILDSKNQPMPGVQIMLASTAAGQSFVRSAGANEHGRFRLAGLAIADTLSLIAQLTDRDFKNLPTGSARIVLERAGLTWPKVGADTAVNWGALQAQLEAARIRQEADPDGYRDKTAKLLKEVVVRARKREERPDDIQRRSLHNTADATIMFDGTTGQYANLYEMIRGRLAGVNVLQGESGYRVLVRGVSSVMGSTEPLFLMDGIPVQGEPGTALLTFNPADIERAELLKNAGSAGIYGVRGANGVIAFYTKSWRTAQSDRKPKAGSIPLQLIGYPSVQREFYVPRYDQPGDMNPDVLARVDRRDVLYWKPLIQTDANGKTQLLFPLSDVVRILRITLQGVTIEGRPVTKVSLVRVQ